MMIIMNEEKDDDGKFLPQTTEIDAFVPLM